MSDLTTHLLTDHDDTGRLRSPTDTGNGEQFEES